MSIWLIYVSKVGKNIKSVESGDVVIVFDENKKCLEWRMVVIESFVKGKDDVVKGVNIWVIVKEKFLCMFKFFKKFYFVEVWSEILFKVLWESV